MARFPLLLTPLVYFFQGVNREDITLESLVRMRKLAESRRLYHQNREGP